MKVWQIASGEAGRDYRHLFTDYDVMLLGPSHLGDASSGAYVDRVPNSALSQVASFAKAPSPGDRVLLRFGREVIGLGEIPPGDENQYVFDPMFQCVYGWDLCHRRRVRWADDLNLGPLADVYRHAKQKPSFTQVHETAIHALVNSVPTEVFSGALKSLPDIDTSSYSDEDLGLALFRAGISNKNIEDILAALRQASRLSAWYRSGGSGRYPTEHEVVSHIVLPLFLGLGWSHQQIAVEWNRVDMAFFKRTPTNSENCVMVLEAKGLGRGLGEVLAQPQAYTEALKLPNVLYIVTTDGENLFLYEKEEGAWRQHPSGYLSVSCLQRNYVLPEGTNPVDTLVRLQPSAM
jgi:hypothetical protein